MFSMQSRGWVGAATTKPRAARAAAVSWKEKRVPDEGWESRIKGKRPGTGLPLRAPRMVQGA